MRAIILIVLTASALGGCVETGQYYYDDPYAPPNRGYYHPQYYNRPGGTYYPSADQQAYEQRRRRIEANCNMNWQNCATGCNTIGNANQRAVCVANCNNALNICKSRN